MIAGGLSIGAVFGWILGIWSQHSGPFRLLAAGVIGGGAVLGALSMLGDPAALLAFGVMATGIFLLHRLGRSLLVSS